MWGLEGLVCIAEEFIYIQLSNVEMRNVNELNKWGEIWLCLCMPVCVWKRERVLGGHRGFWVLWGCTFIITEQCVSSFSNLTQRVELNPSVQMQRRTAHYFPIYFCHTHTYSLIHTFTHCVWSTIIAHTNHSYPKTHSILLLCAHKQTDIPTHTPWCTVFLVASAWELAVLHYGIDLSFLSAQDNIMFPLSSPYQHNMQQEELYFMWIKLWIKKKVLHLRGKKLCGQNASTCF